MFCLASLGILYIMSLLFILYIVFFASSLTLSLLLSLTLFFALFLVLSFALSLVGFPFSLRYSRSTCFSLYIINLDKQLYVELAAY